jgi:DUF1009 family protein
MQDKKLGIFAGRGELPRILIDDCVKKNRQFVLFLLDGEKYENDYSQFDPTIIAYGEIERFLKILEEKSVKDLVFIGAVTKPNFSQLKMDKTGATLLAKILANKILGDDAVLSTVLKFFEKRGFRVLKIDQLLDCVVSTKGAITLVKPNNEDFEEIALGQKAINHFSRFDVGQGVVVAQRQIIAIEALEGTDEMIKRCQNLRKNSILVKMKKKHQNAKVDLPTIGVQTIKNCANSNIKGIAIQANSTLIIDKQKVIETANQMGIFIIVI